MPIAAAHKLFAAFVALALLLCATSLAREGAGTTGDTLISNRAEATYLDDDGNAYGTVSPTITVTVRHVSALTVTPDEIDPSAAVAPAESATRLFRVCNTGNAPDLYTVTRAEVSAPSQIASLYFDSDDSGTLTAADAPIEVNTTLSPRLAPGACVGVIAVVQVGAAVPGSRLSIRLTARSNVATTANGLVSDDGTIINSVGERARLTDPNTPALPPLKLVGGRPRASVAPNETLDYTIAFRNSGSVVARNVLVADDIPTGLDYVAGSLRLQARALTDAEDLDEGRVVNNGRRLELRLAEVRPDEVVNVSFRARTTGEMPAGTGAVNVASLAGENFDAINSSAAVAVINPFGVVYAGRSGGTATIAGARVALLISQTADAPLQTAPGIGFIPNQANDNPFITPASGAFGFTLTPAQLGNASAPATYYLHVAAHGYRTRLIEFAVRPSVYGLSTVRLHALDGQPLAQAGGFTLTDADVTLDNLANVAPNIPLFESQSLQITKSADQPRAEIGDVVSYRVEVRNTTQSALGDAVVRDRLPQSFHYAEGTALLQLPPAQPRPLEPEVSGSEITFHLGALAAGASAALTYRVRVGANAVEGDQVNSAVVTALYPNGERESAGPASATVRVGSGVFSTRQIIVGRVFVDANGNGQFDQGERPVPGARIYLPNGQAVMTDSEGMYNLPAVDDGATVISLDPITVPRALALTDAGRRSERSWTRLLRTPLGGGTLLRQNFALTRTEDEDAGRGDTAARRHVAALIGDKALKNAPLIGEAPASHATELPRNSSSSVPLASSSSAPRVPASPGSRASSSLSSAPLAAGTYEVEADETISTIAPGEVVVLSPAEGEVILQPAMQVVVRVAEGWTATLELNGERVSDTNIGERRVDHKNNVTTLTFVGLSLRPGANRVRVFAVSPDGALGKAAALSVMGRGPARRIEIMPEREEMQAGGRDSVAVRVRALDQWGNPAADGQVGLSTSVGYFERPATETPEPDAKSQSAKLKRDARGAKTTEEAAAGLTDTQPTQIVLNVRGGEATARLFSASAPGQVELLAKTGELEARKRLRLTAELRPAILVGLAEASVGRAAPENTLRRDDARFRSHLEFFYRGPLAFFGQNLLTLAYDSQRALNRTLGRDRVFGFDPQDRVYPIFGDSSTRFEEVESNSKLYARLDHRRSYAMFGDFEADMNDTVLAGYARKLTGVKVHLEDSNGDYITVTGARPDTSFARDVFPASRLGLLRLSHGDVLQGSEQVFLEVRDRRSPELILSRESLLRSVDYNLDPLTGQLFLLRSVSAFDYELNLVQIVVTYEHRADGMTSGVYTGRASKRFNSVGLRLGASFVEQQQNQFGAYRLGGLDGEQELWNHGSLRFEYATSRGDLTTAGNVFGGERHAGGSAYSLQLLQPFKLYNAELRADYSRADEGFFNPFGATVAPGSRRLGAALELKPRRTRSLRLGFTNERNRTTNVDNERNTFSFLWNESFGDKLQGFLGYDYRRLTDSSSGQNINSQLVTIGAQYRPIDKLEVSVKREQNLAESDPTFPNQTTLAARYRWDDRTSLFFTQRLASAPIVPISDTASTGFAATNSRRETAVGVETRFGRNTSLVSRYQIENGIGGTDSFAVIGLQNRLPFSKQLFLDLGFEHGFHLAGEGQNFTAGALGATWMPTMNLRASARYELRDQTGGLGQVLSAGAAGRVGDGITTLARLQWARTNFAGRDNDSLLATAAVALRPVRSDTSALLFSYTQRSVTQSGFAGRAGLTERSRTLSSDGFWQPARDTELFGRVALKFGGNSRDGLINASALTYIAQLRLQRRLRRAFDVAGEGRILAQPSTHTARRSFGAEIGYWFMPEVRFGFGYNFASAEEPAGSLTVTQPRGFYFTISTKLSLLFDLFGASSGGLAPAADAPVTDEQNNEPSDAKPPAKSGDKKTNGAPSVGQTGSQQGPDGGAR